MILRRIRKTIVISLLGILFLSGWGVAAWISHRSYAPVPARPVIAKSGTTPAASQPDQGAYAGWASYTLQYDKLSFRYPSSWSVRTVKSEHMCDYVDFSSPDGFDFLIQDGQGPPMGDFSAIDATEPVTFAGQPDYIAYEGDISQDYGYPPALVVGGIVLSNPADAMSRPSDRNAISNDGFGGYLISITFNYDNPLIRSLSGKTAPNDPEFKNAKLVVESMHY